MNKWLSAVLVALVSLSCLVSTDARAQELEVRREQAKELANTAFDMMNEGKLEEAIKTFLEADERFHSPVFLLFVAEAEEKLGRLTAARARLQKIVDETFPDFAPDSFRKAQATARERLVALDKKIPTATIIVEGTQGETPTVTLDGQPFDGVGQPRQLNPGQHRARATTPDGRSVNRSFELAEGDQTRVELLLTGKSEEGEGLKPQEYPNTGEKDDGRSYMLPAIAFAVGGVGIVMGAAAGLVFLGESS